MGAERLRDGSQRRLDDERPNRGDLGRELLTQELVEPGTAVVGRSPARGRVDLEDAGEPASESAELSTGYRGRRG